MIHEALSREIIAAAMKVHGTLKPGLDKLYKTRSLSNLQNADIAQISRSLFRLITTVTLLGRSPDVIVDDLVVVDPKVVEIFHKDHLAQMLGYLSITGLELALLLNFKHRQPSVEADGTIQANK